MGCASTNQSDNGQGKIKIASQPAGAIVYADGTEIGPTPIEILPGNYFHSGFVGFSYRYYGKLTIRKAGCETWSTEVNDSILSKDVLAKLKCDPSAPLSSAAAPSSESTTDSTSNPAAKDQYVDRLERIETLHKKGLISDDEYKQLRTRIIEKL
jgi:hypothetical protein